VGDENLHKLHSKLNPFLVFLLASILNSSISRLMAGKLTH
jgi:hypothetical protein